MALTKHTRPLTVALLLALVMLAVPLLVPAVSGLTSIGGLLSEKLVVRQGSTTTNLLVGNATKSNLTIVGMAPVVTTGAATSPLPLTITLNGTITSMNGQPTSTAYFQWGYTSALGNTTPTTTMAAIGSFSQTINYNPNNRLYWRAVVDGDGTQYGTTRSTVPAPGVGGYLLKSLIGILLAVAICLGVLVTIGKGSPMGMMSSAVIGLVAYVIVSALLNAF